MAYLLLKMVPEIAYVDSRWDKNGDDAHFILKSNIRAVINNILEELDYERVRVEFKDGKTYDLNTTMEKLNENTNATLRLLFLTRCKITDHSKSKCRAQSICVLDMESYKTFVASIFIHLIELDAKNFNLFFKSCEKYYILTLTIRCSNQQFQTKETQTIIN